MGCHSNALITRKQLNAREQEWFNTTKEAFKGQVKEQRFRVSQEVATLGNPCVFAASARCRPSRAL